MRASDLLAELEAFAGLIDQHAKLWGRSLDDTIPDYPIRNADELERQAVDLNRRLGRLRPYILRFHDQWIMQHPATGITWDALDSAVANHVVAQVKGPSLRAVQEQVAQICGAVESLDPEAEIPPDRTRPIGSQAPIDRVILAYLQALHPFIAAGCVPLYRDGHFTQAVEEAAKAVFQYIRNKSGLAIDGAALVDKTFSVGAPILAFSDLSDDTKRNEQVGFMELLKGFAKGVRHPLAHSHGRQEEAQKAFEYLVMASLFCRRIDDASPKTLPV